MRGGALSGLACRPAALPSRSLLVVCAPTVPRTREPSLPRSRTIILGAPVLVAPEPHPCGRAHPPRRPRPVRALSPRPPRAAHRLRRLKSQRAGDRGPGTAESAGGSPGLPIAGCGSGSGHARRRWRSVRALRAPRGGRAAKRRIHSPSLAASGRPWPVPPPRGPTLSPRHADARQLTHAQAVGGHPLRPKSTGPQNRMIEVSPLDARKSHSLQGRAR